MTFGPPIHLGSRSTWGGEIPFILHPQDARFHTYIIGKTGSGKTTLLKNLIAQHIQQGGGVALNDPHGDLSQKLFEFIPGQESTPGLGGIEDFGWPDVACMSARATTCLTAPAHQTATRNTA